ncbi:DUF3667 domain-containing protein [soil metagenome]
MSHLKERTEKICLNCNAALEGAYCHICGQENIEPKESAWHLVMHFFNDITHFDGKFFSSIKLLITRPGFLSSEYAKGRRASYLNPIRMYIFTSAIFFLIFFSFFHVTDTNIDNSIKFDIGGKSLPALRAMSPDSLKAFTTRANHGIPVSHSELEKYFDSVKNNGGVWLTDQVFPSKAAYDSLLKSGTKKHNWVQRQLIYKEIDINKKFHNSLAEFLKVLLSTFVHSFPQMLFISLPLFALFLKLLYRRQKEFYYVSHGIFSIHFFIFTFIAMLFIFGFAEAKEVLHWKWLSYFQTAFQLGIIVYLYKAMRNFYQQRRAKTIAKFLLLAVFSIALIGVIFSSFILFSFMKI